MLTLPDFKEKQVIFIHGKLNQKLQFSNDNLIIRDTETNLVENKVPCYKIFALFLIGDTTLTSVLLRKAANYGFVTVLMGRNFRVYSVMGAQTEGNYLLREKQYTHIEGMEISKLIIQNKISNQLKLLKAVRSKSEKIKSAIEKLDCNLKIVTEKEKEIQDSQTLMGVEGYCSKEFFQSYFEKFGWKSRLPRTRHDIINLLLDVGYTYLFSFIESHLRLYGFDLYKGVFHRPFYDRKSLVCDIIEPFRCIIDASLRKALALKQVDPNDFILIRKQYEMKYKKSEKYTKLIAESIIERKEEIFLYVQNYYRAFMQGKELNLYPKFMI